MPPAAPPPNPPPPPPQSSPALEGEGERGRVEAKLTIKGKKGLEGGDGEENGYDRYTVEEGDTERVKEI